MEKFFSTEWKTHGIYDAIKLSTIEIVMDQELLAAALSFWYSTTNIMVLPLGPNGFTVLDISAILGTSPSGLPVDTVIPGYQFDLDLKSLLDEHAFEAVKKKDQEATKEEVQKLHKNFFNYNTLIHHFADRGEKDLWKWEHEAFFFYWYNKFIVCTKSNKCLIKNMPVVTP